MHHYAKLWHEHLMRLVKMYEAGYLTSTVENGKFSPHRPFRGVDSVPYAVDVSAGNTVNAACFIHIV